MVYIAFLVLALYTEQEKGYQMKKIFTTRILPALALWSCVGINELHAVTEERVPMTKIQKNNPVQKHVLKNGMTILVLPVHNIPKVSLQLWYNVGSKDEKTGEKGIAHLIEHMIFKGTDTLSETDINVVSHMLSGGINAFTSYDYTGYLFNLPTHHWQESLPIMADCMQNAAFKEDHLSSEMKAVIQELKMYRDDYQTSLIEQLVSTIFVDHPYHFPIIGFKQDLWSVHSKDLKNFYKKHYVPNNATLVVVGDVQPEQVFELAEKSFGAIKSNPDYKKEEFYFNKDIGSKSVTLYRDIQQPLEVLVYVVPGIKNRKEHVLEIASWALGAGKSSRLYKKLVDELKLVTSLSSSFYDLFDHGLFFILFEPKRIEDREKIEAIINQEIASLAHDGLEPQELDRAIKKAQMKLYSLLENTEKQAYEIGKYYLATGDENYIFNYLNDSPEKIAQEVQALFARYFRPSVAHKGTVLPLPEEEKKTWHELQLESDEEDNRILSAHKRETPLEEPSYAKKVQVKEPSAFEFPKAQTATLPNGIKVFYYNNDNNIPKINLVLEFKAKFFYDDQEKPGLYNFVANMMTEGTEKYSATELAQEIESRGMSLSVYPGGLSMSMLSSDFEKGLEILDQILAHATFDEEEIEKVREQIIADIKNFWDEPKSFAGQLVRERIYGSHPYSKNMLGTEESVASITRKDLQQFYKKYISPSGAKASVVGDLEKYDVQKVLNKTLGAWQGSVVEDIEFPTLATTQAGDVNYPINRDQIVLCYAGVSVDRKNPDFDKLLLFDQIFGGGALGSLHSRLFSLREQSGLFYTINGSLIANADEQPGIVLIKTIVSLDRLKEAEKAIKKTIETAADTITDQEFKQARHAVLNSLMNNFESNSKIAQSFLFLDKYKFPATFFDNRAQDLAKISIAQMQQAVKKLLKTDNLLTFRIGRVQETTKA